MRFLLFFLGCSIVMVADTLSATYDVRYGLFGVIGKAGAALTQDTGHYRIVIEANATGLAAVLSGDMKDRYESEGQVVKGRLVPDIYRNIRRQGKRVTTWEFHFDHKRSRVFKTREECDGDTCKRRAGWYDRYARDDILSLYFNLRILLEQVTPPDHMKFPAIGPKEGFVEITFPAGEMLEDARDILGEEPGHVLIVTVHQDIFTSEEGRFYLLMDDNGITTTSVLTDAVLFGDVRGERVW